MKQITNAYCTEIMTDTLRLARDLMTESCAECFELLYWRDKFNLEQAIIAVNTAANGICDRLIKDIEERFADVRT